MKKITGILIIAAGILCACSSDISLDPAVSLFAPKPEVYDETAIFRIASMGIDSASAQTIPVIFGGSAERDADYTVSADAFVLGGENPVDSIVVTTLKLGTGKDLTMTLVLPSGIGEGKYVTSGFTLQDKIALVSLSDSYRMLTDSLDVEFKTVADNGRNKVLKSDAEMTLSVDTENSTAIEGTDFVFSDSSRFVIRAGESEGRLEIKSLNPHPAKGRDKIVLNIGFSDKFDAGENQKIEICLMDTLWKVLDGKWAIDTLVTDSTYMRKYWDESYTGLELLPKFHKNDNLTFDFESCLFKPSFRSDFKNYFIGNSNLRKGSEIEMDLGDGKMVPVQTFLIDNTNRNFSDAEKSEDKESYIGLRITEGEKTDTLDLYVIDYMSKSFMPELVTNEKYAPEKPVAASPGLFLNITLTN